jgi:hypothetical protein
VKTVDLANELFTEIETVIKWKPTK